MGRVPGTGLFSNFLTTFCERLRVRVVESVALESAARAQVLAARLGALHSMLGSLGLSAFSHQMEGVRKWRAHSKCSLRVSVPAPPEQAFPWHVKKRRL